MKLHGDYRSATLNGQKETENFTHLFYDAIAQAVKNRTLIFMGYGGNDVGISQLFERLSRSGSAPSAVYWLGNDYESKVVNAFDKEIVQIVRLNDFDRFMRMALEHGELPHLSLHRLSEFSEDYVSYLTTVAGAPLSPMPDDWSRYVISALSKDKTAGKRKMREGIKLYPSCAAMLGSYAHYCKDRFDNYVEAERYYEKALKVDPGHWRTHVHVATYWRDKENRDLKKADKSCRRAIEIYDKDINARVIHFGILIALGKLKDARNLAERLRGIPMTKENRLEFQYYGLFIDYSDSTFQSMSEQVANGGRTPDYEYEFILNSSTGNSHEHLVDLRILAANMTQT